MQDMKYPHIRFAALLLLLDKDIEKYIYPLPVPNGGDIMSVFPKCRNTPSWLKKEDLWAFKKRTGDAINAYSLWSDERIRNIINVGILYSVPKLVEFINKKLPLTVNAETLRLYERVFLDVSDWTFHDWNEYLEELDKSDQLLDRKILRLFLEDANVEYLLKLLYINADSIDTDSILKEMLLAGYGEFQGSSGKDRLPFGKFVMALVKQLDKDDDKDDKMLYERISIKLKKVVEAEHSSPLPQSAEQMGFKLEDVLNDNI